MIQNEEVPMDYFYYHYPDQISIKDAELFVDNPYGFADYLLMLRWRSRVRRAGVMESESNSINHAR